MEQRRILWTTYKNLKLWFDNWKQFLEELGFAHRNDDCDLVVPPDQLARILNFDETCLSLDGSKGNRGGRPEVIFFNPNFPQLGRGMSKTSLTTTYITGSNGLGEALPPHFQFQTSATSEDREKMRLELVEFTPKVLGKFGCNDEREWVCTFGMNPKGGMDDEQFEKYVEGSLFPLYPDAEDVPGKRVILAPDSGPGRANLELLAKLRLNGFYLYPGVPNTTSVTQETDRNYGPFKTQFRTNLDDVVQARLEHDPPVSVSLQPWLVGLIVYGGVDAKTGFEIKPNDSAFQASFSREMCVKAWVKVGRAVLGNNWHGQSHGGMPQRPQGSS